MKIIYVALYLPICSSLSPTTCLSIYNIYLPAYLSMYLFIHLHICLSIEAPVTAASTHNRMVSLSLDLSTTFESLPSCHELQHHPPSCRFFWCHS